MIKIPEQEQLDVEVLMPNGRPRKRSGVATGNNAAWLCDCGYDSPLVGTTFKYNTPVFCKGKNCSAQYEIRPTGNRGSPVKHIQRIK